MSPNDSPRESDAQWPPRMFEGPDVGLYRIGAYLNLTLIAVLMILFGFVTPLTGDATLETGITLYVAGGLLLVFAIRRITTSRDRRH